MIEQTKVSWPLYLNRNTNIPDNICTFYHDPHNLPRNDHPIERITHHFWLKTHKKTLSDKELPEEDFNKLLNQYSQLNYEEQCINIDYHLDKQNNSCPTGSYYGTSRFDHFFWTNDKNLIPQTASKLEAIGVKVQNIYALAEEHNYQYIDQINQYIDKAFYGSMVDILKYAAVFFYGGASLDINFSINTPNLEQLFNSYSYIGISKSSFDFNRTQETFPNLIENSFIATHSNHSLIHKTLNEANKIFTDYDNLLCKKISDTCDDLDLSHMTWGAHDYIIRHNIENNETEVNEIFSPCPLDPELDIGIDQLFGLTWMLEQIID